MSPFMSDRTPTGLMMRTSWLCMTVCIAFGALFSAAHAAKVLPVLNDPIDSQTISPNLAPIQIDLDTVFGTEEIDDNAVRFTSQFSIGDVPLVMDFALFTNRTPATRTNFLNYVNDGDYINQFIHRTIPGFVAQGGGFIAELDGDSFNIVSVSTDDSVINEFGISNTRWTVAMAKLGSDPNSATSQWFINLGANSSNLDNQNGGFTAFGRVLQSTQDDATVLTSTGNFPIYNFNSPFENIPLIDYDGNLTLGNLNLFETATLVPVDPGDAGESTTLIYSIGANSNPGLVTASVINDNELSLAFTADTLGTATITVTATDSVGNAVDTTFTITIAEFFRDWRSANFTGDDIADDSISGPEVDANKDGVTNLELFAHDLSLTELHLSPVTVSFVESDGSTVPQFVFPFRNDIAGLSFDLEFSEDLAVTDPWGSVPFNEVSRQVNGNIDTITLEISTTGFTPTSPGFYRWFLQLDAE